MNTKVIFISGETISLPSNKVKIKVKDKIVKAIKDDKVMIIPFTSILRIDYPKPPRAKAYFNTV